MPVEVVFNARKWHLLANLISRADDRFTINVTEPLKTAFLPHKRHWSDLKECLDFLIRVWLLAKPFKAPQLSKEQVRRMVKDDMKAAGKSEEKLISTRCRPLRIKRLRWVAKIRKK